jgi:hypothetical protein
MRLNGTAVQSRRFRSTYVGPTPIRGTVARLVMTATVAVSLLLPVGPAAANELAQVQLAFDAWQPTSGTCIQVVTFRVLPLGTQTPPSGDVVLGSDTGAEIGRATIAGFGNYSVQGACATDDAHHRVTLHYSGDTTYAGQSVTSPDLCSRSIVTDPDAMEFFAHGKPFFMCRTNYGHSPRELDGRMVTGFSSLSTISGDVPYGLSVGVSYAFSDLAGAAPTAMVQHVVDGVTVDTRTIAQAQNNSFDVSTTALSVGGHTAGVAYPGDPRWAPSEKIFAFRVTKARPGGAIGVKKWRLMRGDRARMWFRLRNPYDRDAKAPTGKADLYVGNQKVKTVKVKSKQRKVSVVLPPLRRKGQFRLRVVYRGDGRYLKVDSASRHWTGGQQYINVS